MTNKPIFKALAVSLFFFFSCAIAAQEASDSLSGFVAATFDAAGKVTSATLTAETYDDKDNIVSIAYQIELDEKGRELASQYNGFEVKVTGKISGSSEKTDGRTIKVISFEANEILPEPLVEDDLPLLDEDLPDIGTAEDIDGMPDSGKEQ
ncbi:MAG: hypothetical protein ACOYXC_20510 [Candidatus Rifleibacteriota bacterium]